MLEKIPSNKEEIESLEKIIQKLINLKKEIGNKKFKASGYSQVLAVKITHLDSYYC
jgi:hypothetical protein